MFHAAKAYGLTAVVLLLVVSPAFRDPPRDSFPLSNFPMFSQGRPSPRFILTHALGVDAAGARRPLSPWIATGNREVLQAMVWLGAALRDPDGSCETIAARVARHGSAEVRAVELVTSDFDSVAYFVSSPAPVSRRVHARCEVGR
jgi:hypothetical protein